MLRIKYFGATILCLSLWAGALAAQTSAQKQRVEQFGSGKILDLGSNKKYLEDINGD